MYSDIKYFKIACSVDNVIFGFDSDQLFVLLIQRGEEPFKGSWALPGDLVLPDEDLRGAPIRILKELTGIDNVFLEQIKTFGKLRRHPDGRVITIVYYSLVNKNKIRLKPSSFASVAKWCPVNEVDELAFDHKEILTEAFSQLKQSVQFRPIGFELLSEKFTLSELQTLYETILGEGLDKRNFRKKILAMNLLVDIGELQKGVAHRPAKLYRFDQNKYLSLKDAGFSFAI